MVESVLPGLRAVCAIPAGSAWTTYLGFLAGCLLLSAVLVGLATARVRGVALEQAGRPAATSPPRDCVRIPRGVAPRLPGPSLDANPVPWREWHRTRPSRMMRVAWGLYAALGLLWVLLAMAQPSVRPIFQDRKAAVMNVILGHDRPLAR